MGILGYFFIVSLLISVIYYLGSLHKGKIKDKNKDFIPDAVEFASKQMKRRREIIKEELRDVANAITGDNPPPYDESKKEE